MDLINFMHARLDRCFKRNDNNSYFISLINPVIWLKMFYYFLIFHKKNSKNLVTSKMRNKFNLLQCKLFDFFYYAYACYVFETMDRVWWMTTKWEYNAWLFLAGYLFTWYANEMYAYVVGGIFFPFFIMVKLWWIYYYIQGKTRVKDTNSLPFVP